MTATDELSTKHRLLHGLEKTGLINRLFNEAFEDTPCMSAKGRELQDIFGSRLGHVVHGYRRGKEPRAKRLALTRKSLFPSLSKNFDTLCRVFDIWFERSDRAALLKAMTEETGVVLHFDPSDGPLRQSIRNRFGENCPDDDALTLAVIGFLMLRTAGAAAATKTLPPPTESPAPSNSFPSLKDLLETSYSDPMLQRFWAEICALPCQSDSWDDARNLAFDLLELYEIRSEERQELAASATEEARNKLEDLALEHHDELAYLGRSFPRREQLNSENMKAVLGNLETLGKLLTEHAEVRALPRKSLSVELELQQRLNDLRSDIDTVFKELTALLPPPVEPKPPTGPSKPDSSGSADTSPEAPAPPTATTDGGNVPETAPASAPTSSAKPTEGAASTVHAPTAKSLAAATKAGSAPETASSETPAISAKPIDGAAQKLDTPEVDSCNTKNKEESAPEAAPASAPALSVKPADGVATTIPGPAAQSSTSGATSGSATVPAPAPASSPKPAGGAAPTVPAPAPAPSPKPAGGAAPTVPAPAPALSPKTGNGAAPVVLEPAAGTPTAGTRAESAPETAPASQPPARDLPPELRSYEAYRDAFWFAPSGDHERAPWSLDGFAEDLDRRIVAGLQRDPIPFSQCWVFASACEQVGASSVLRPRDLAALAQLWADPVAASSGADESRAGLLRGLLDPDQTGPSSSWWPVLLLLEALRPSASRPWAAAEVDALLDAVPLESNALRSLVHALFNVAIRGGSTSDALHELRRQRAVKPEDTPDGLARQVATARSELQDALNAPFPFKKRLAHCVKAWEAFLEEVREELAAMLPAPGSSPRAWDPTEIKPRIAKLHVRFERLFDAEHARYEARSAMDRDATRLLDKASALNDLLRRAQSAQSRQHRAGVQEIPDQILSNLFASPPLARLPEELSRRLLDRVCSPRGAFVLQPLTVTLGDLCSHPDLVRILPEVATTPVKPDQPTVVARVQDFTDQRRAAAIWRCPPCDDAAATQASWELLRDRLAVRDGGGPLIARFAEVLGTRAQSVSRDDHQEAQVRCLDATARLRTVWQRLEEAASPLYPAIKTALDDAERWLDDPALSPPDTRLLETWMRRVADEGDRGIASVYAGLEAEAATSKDPVRGKVLDLLRRGLFGEARILLEGREVSPGRLALRETPFRHNAAAVYPDPLETLERLIDGGDPDLKPVAQAWLDGVSGKAHQGDRALRSAFRKLVFPEKAGVDETRAVKVSCRDLRDHLGQLNPTWFPQLAGYTNLVVLTPPVPPNNPAFQQETAELVARYDGDLCLVLAPHLTVSQRERTLAELRKRANPAALVDDLDLCRILNPGGQRLNMVIATLEILLEQQLLQQRWKQVDPFALSELEMFVGRREDAQALARGKQYSRLFSGRRLGKSALLRFIENTEDGKPLPSGRTLRVLYVIAAGASAEPDLVGRILEEMEKRFGLTGLDRIEGGPAERLLGALRAFDHSLPQASLLVVLDEADEFVLSQIRAFEEHHESCLSFRMRSQIFEKESDEQGLPRVRFVFAGYRATQLDEGAWANWGQVLRLRPLSVEDGARLIAGPLARLGIDCAGQAVAIALRCGCQPAVILRFGQRLLAHLEHSRPLLADQPFEVTGEDVSTVFDDPQVHNEIRQITLNNFSGHPRGEAVYRAVLYELLKLPPGQGLSDAAEVVLARLKEIGGHTGWLRQDDAAAELEVERLLREFVERELLRAGPGREASFFLRFPHHLTVLAPLAERAVIVEKIENSRRSSGSESASPSLLGATAMQRLRSTLMAATPPSEVELVEVPVVGSHWIEALQHASAGLAARLGEAAAALRRVGAAEGLELLGKLPPGADVPALLGGADLLRAALEAELLPGAAAGRWVFDCLSMGRMSPATNRWWFTRMRGIEFAGRGLELVERATGGVPLLVRELDLLLQQAGVRGGTDLDEAEVTKVLARFEERLPELARLLEGGDPAFALRPRERELLWMAVESARRELGGDDSEAVAVAMDLVADDRGWATVRREDAVPLGVLQHLGLLPVDPDGPPSRPLERLQALDKGDAVERLVRFLGV